MPIREATDADLPFLQKMWHVAAFWQPEVFVLTMEEAVRIPEISRYIEGWGRDGDAAVVAEEDGHLLGAAWYRTFTPDEPGYGFVDPTTPELALGVEAEARGRGIGTGLLEALIEHARGAGLRALSLSVNEDNPSRRIYLRCGFVDVAFADASYVMVRSLE